MKLFGRKTWLWILAAFAAMLLLSVAAIFYIAHSEWLSGKVRASIVEQVERATGGRVEAGTFRFDWQTLTAQVSNFVIHGTEPPGAAPLLTVDNIRVGLRIVSLLRRDVSIDSVEALRPVTHLITYVGGGTNLPRPKISAHGSIPETILNLKIARFSVSGGTVIAEFSGHPTRGIPWNARGENLIVYATYNPAARSYAGKFTLAPLHLALDGVPFDVQLEADVAMERDRFVFSKASAKTRESEVVLSNITVTNFNAPVAEAQYDGRFSLAEVARVLKLNGKQSGNVNASGEARFVSLTDFHASGKLNGSDIAVDSLRNLRIAADFEGNPEGLVLRDVQAYGLGGHAAFSGELRGSGNYRASGRIDHFELRALAALRIKRQLPYDGIVAGSFEVSGRRTALSARTQLAISPAASGPAARGEIALQYDSVGAKIALGRSWLELPKSRIDVSGTLGDRLDVRLQSNDVNDLLPVWDRLPKFTYDSLAFAGTVGGPLNNPRLAGHASATNLVYNQHVFQALSGDVTASRSSATVSDGAVAFGDVQARGAGSIQLNEWIASDASPLTASIEVANADLTKILAMAGHKEVEVSGALSATAQIAGTAAGPHIAGDVTLARGFIYGQPYDSISGRLQSINTGAQSLTGVFVSGPKRVNIGGRFEHAGTQFPAGTLEFNLTSNTMPLNQIALVRKRQPDIHGFGKFHADGALKISHDAKHEIQFNLLSLNADASANSVELGGRNLGDAHFTAQTANDVMTARFDSNAVNAAIHGTATVQLTGDYPVSGKVDFSNAGLNALAALIVRPESAAGLTFDGAAEGSIAFSGPAKKPADLTASIDVSRLEARPLPGTDFYRALPNFAFSNSGPIRASLSNSIVRIETARFKAPQTDLTLDGTVGIDRSALNLHVQGSVNLALARTFNPDLTSSGSLQLNATVRGTFETPDVSGRASVHAADFHYTDFVNGLTNANAELSFSGTHATIQSFTAESGGGKVEASGFAALTKGLVTFRLETRAHGVRVRYPEGISTVSDAALTLTGTSQRSEASGSITVHRVTVNPKSDAATILANAAEPIRTSATGSLFSNMNLDVQIATAPDVALQTSVTETIQADANLRLRGTPTNPAVLGRINITQGDMVFFGNRYSINTGSISFFNPTKIDPILNVDLETKARGVDVILTVSGPVNKLNVSYRSDPPLQFSDIVALLATGRAPVGSTVAGDTGQSQGFQHLGASDLIGQALANPVAGRLQRFFGVSRLKIDPQLTGITGSPEARLTIEQQVTPDILFTYITDVSSTSTQLIRVEWSFNRHWSAILIREENGYVGLDFAYKKRFK